MKIALAQLNYHIGNFELNTTKIISTIQKAKNEKVDLVVFSELAVCGYPPEDLLLYDAFVANCEKAIQEITTYCQDIACIIGVPTRIENEKRLSNSAVFIANGMVKQIINKSLLPTYDVFDEARYFSPATSVNCIVFNGEKIALTICEDLWNENEQALYSQSPMDELSKLSPDLMINIAASPFGYDHCKNRLEVLSKNAKKYQLPLIYVNQVGAHTDLIFDGSSMVLSPKGEISTQLKSFEEDFQIIDLAEQSTIINPVHQEEIAQIHNALVLGIKDYFEKSGFQKAVLGLSGGIDSAVVCALAAEALGGENILGILMPSRYSSEHSIKDALDLVKNLACKYEIVPINEAVSAFDLMLSNAFAGLSPDLTEENIQARCRGIIVMAMSNKFGNILLNTSNKSECAVGYGTLYGDMCGALSVLGDVYKTQVFQLARYINREREIIPENTIVKPPSAELRPDQKDSDSLPDYDILDKILYQHIEKRQSLEQICQLGYDEKLVSRVLRMVSNAEFKRHQSPPILRVSSKSFNSSDRKFPIVAKRMN